MLISAVFRMNVLRLYMEYIYVRVMHFWRQITSFVVFWSKIKKNYVKWRHLTNAEWCLAFFFISNDVIGRQTPWRVMLNDLWLKSLISLFFVIYGDSWRLMMFWFLIPKPSTIFVEKWRKKTFEQYFLTSFDFIWRLFSSLTSLIIVRRHTTSFVVILCTKR